MPDFSDFLPEDPIQETAPVIEPAAEPISETVAEPVTPTEEVASPPVEASGVEDADSGTGDEGAIPPARLKEVIDERNDLRDKYAAAEPILKFMQEKGISADKLPDVLARLETQRTEQTQAVENSVKGTYEKQAAAAAEQAVADTYGTTIVQQMTDEGLDPYGADKSEYAVRMAALREHPTVKAFHEKALRIERADAMSRANETLTTVKSLVTDFPSHNSQIVSELLRANPTTPADHLRAIAQATHEHTESVVSQRMGGVASELAELKAGIADQLKTAREEGKREALAEQASGRELPVIGKGNGIPATGAISKATGDFSRFLPAD